MDRRGSKKTRVSKQAVILSDAPLSSPSVAPFSMTGEEKS